MALQIAPLIVLERQILILLYLFMARITLCHLMAVIWHGGDFLNWLLCVSLLAMIAGLERRLMLAIMLDIIGFF